MTTQHPASTDPRVDDLIRRIERLERRLGVEASPEGGVAALPPRAAPMGPLPLLPGTPQGAPMRVPGGDVGAPSAPSADVSTSPLEGKVAASPGPEPGSATAARARALEMLARGTVSSPPASAPSSPIPPTAPSAAIDRREGAARPSGGARGAWEGVSLESLIGGRAFAIAGALIVLIGVGLFLKFAYEQGWIGPAGQCLSVAGFGALLLGAGELVRRRVGRVASIGPSAAGLGALFFAAFAAHEVFHPPVVSLEVALAMIAGVTALGVGIGVVARLASLVGVAMVGGYLAPVLLGTLRPSEMFMPSYLLGLLAVGAGSSALFASSPEAARFRVLRTLGWWGTMVLGTIWIGLTGMTVPANGLLFVAGAWVIVHAEMLLASHAPVRSRPALVESGEAGDVPGVWRARWIIGSFSTSVWSTVWGVLLMARVNPAMDWVGAAGVGALCAAGAGLALTLDPIPDVLRHGARTAREQLGAGLLVQTGALTIATIGLALGGWAQIVAWLALGCAAVGAGRWIRSKALNVYGLIVLGIGAVRLMTWDFAGAFHAPVAMGVAGLGLSVWSLQMVLAAAAWMGAGSLLISDGRRVWREVGVVAACVGCVLLAMAPMHSQSVGGAVSVWWCAIGVGALGVGRWRRLDGLMWFGTFALTIASAKLATLDMGESLRAGAGVLSVAGLGLTAWSGQMALAAVAWIVAAVGCIPRHAKEWPDVRHGAMCSAAVLLALAPLHPEATGGALSVWWCVLGLGTLALGRWRRLVPLAMCGAAMLMVGGLKLPAIDLARAFEAEPMLSPGGVALTAWSGQMALAALVWLAAGLLLRRDQRPWMLGVVRLLVGGAVALLALAPTHQGTNCGVVTLWWAALAIGATAAHRLDRRLGLDLMGLSLNVGAVIPWMIAYVRTGWASFDAPGGLHPGLGVALVLVVCAVVFGRRVMRGERHASGRRIAGVVSLIDAGVLLFGATSLEVARVASLVFAGDRTSAAAVLSIWWGLFGVAVLALGFVRRAAPVRFAGLGLLGLGAFKAVLFDLAQVSEGWRVASFIGVGLLMIGVAVGYARLSRMLREPGEASAPIGESDGRSLGAAGHSAG